MSGYSYVFDQKPMAHVHSIIWMSLTQSLTLKGRDIERTKDVYGCVDGTSDSIFFNLENLFTVTSKSEFVPRIIRMIREVKILCKE